MLDPHHFLQVSVDPSSSYLVCSDSFKILCLYDIMAGDMVAQAVGHGDVITGVIFLPDCKHLVSVSTSYAHFPDLVFCLSEL